MLTAPGAATPAAPARLSLAQAVTSWAAAASGSGCGADGVQEVGGGAVGAGAGAGVVAVGAGAGAVDVGPDARWWPDPHATTVRARISPGATLSMTAAAPPGTRRRAGRSRTPPILAAPLDGRTTGPSTSRRQMRSPDR